MSCDICRDEYTCSYARRNSSRFCSRSCASKWKAKLGFARDNTGSNNPMFGKMHPNKGKTLEQIAGKERAAQLRRQLIERNKANKGKASKWKGVSYTERYGEKRAVQILDAMANHPSQQRMTGKSYDEIYGKERALQIRQRQSDNSALRGKLPRKSRGISGMFHGKRFRSSFELAFLMSMHAVDRFSHIDVEPIKIGYTVIDEITHRCTYTPDYLMRDTNELVEIKPCFKIEHNLDRFSEKKLAAEMYCKGRNLRYVVLTEVELQQWLPKPSRKHIREISGVKLDGDTDTGAMCESTETEQF